MFLYSSLCTNRIHGIMVSVLASSGADCGINTGWIKLETIKLVFICCFSTKHAALKSKSNDSELG
jgi:hypothetical protein